jgi:hypothetical protein
MVTSFPRANLDPASDEWRRAVEKLIREALGGASKARREVRAYGSGQAGVVNALAQRDAEMSQLRARVDGHEEEVAPVEPPLIPTAPTLTTSLGSVVAAWDGNLLRFEEIGEPPTLEAPARGFRGVRAELLTGSTEIEGSGGLVDETWTPVGQPISGRGGIAITDLPVGSVATVRLVAFNLAGDSGPSERAEIVVEGVVAGQITEGAVIADNIAANAVGTTQLVHGAVTREILAAQAVGPNEIADFAITARKFNTSAHILY